MFRGLFLVVGLAWVLKHDRDPAWSVALIVALLGVVLWALADFTLRRRDAVARYGLLVLLVVDVLELGIAISERRFPGLVQIIAILVTVSAFRLLYQRRRSKA